MRAKAFEAVTSQFRLLGVAIAVACLTIGNAAAEQPIVFEHDIRPLLSDNCFACHGPDEQKREAGLRLDVRADAFAEGWERPIINAGEPEQSELYLRVSAEDETLRMPPEESGKSLTAEEIQRIKRWIEQGAQWQDHWSLVTPVRPDLPSVEQSGWARNPIDRFVLARLEQQGLEPSPEADRRTLIRRLTLDLTGLPPSLEEVQAFVNDTSPGAYEKVVDRLLESEHYGEHMARFWLDAARYGDTHGLHLDNYREMWPYRDWVIEAFNRNLPYDRFTVEQLAGDLLPNPTLDQQVATGFNRAHVTTNEGGTIPEEFYVRNVVDRVETTGTVFLGLTLGCAVCHDHKFDPISQTEFYQLFAFFNNLDAAPMDGNVKDHYPVAKVPNDEQEQQLSRIRNQLQTVADQRRQRTDQLEPAARVWLSSERQSFAETAQEPSWAAGPDEGLVARFALDEQQGKSIGNSVDTEKSGTATGQPRWISGRFGGGYEFAADNAIDLGNNFGFSSEEPFSLGGWIQTPGDVTGAVVSKTDVKGLRRGYELTVDRGYLEFHLVSKWQSYAIDVKTTSRVLEPGQWHHVFVTYDGSGKAAGVALYVDGRMQPRQIKTDSILAGENHRSIKNSKALLLGRRENEAAFAGGRIDDVRIYDRRLSETDVARVALAGRVKRLLQAPAEGLTTAERDALLQFYANRSDARYGQLVEQCAELRAEQAQVTEQMATTLVYRERETPRTAYVLERGQYDRKGEEVERQTPAALPPMDAELRRDRLGFARWLVSPEHPLTARVAVNRFWQQVFGVGIVKTAGDFGSQGDPPSHPKLLDWLAVDFRESGWDVKRLVKLMVTSAAYRQSSRVRPELVERGVRFVQVFHRGWDQHSSLPKNLPQQCGDVDQPSAALIRDLKQRGLLDDTLVVWGGEFGRTAYCQGKLTRETYGRDHHPKCFSAWLAGGGIQGGVVHGETDDFSYNIVKDPVHIHDLNATILHCLGIDDRRLSFKFQGLDQKLTGVEPTRVVKEVLA